MSLFLYMASVSAVIIGGVWIAVSTWLNRMPRTHLLAIFIVFWGLTLSAVEVLPRAGYAQPDPLREVWSCGCRRLALANSVLRRFALSNKFGLWHGDDCRR
jgi:hypothetical protein